MQNNLQINAKAAANPLARRRRPFVETPRLLPVHLPSGSGAGPSSAVEVGASGFSTSRHTPSPLGASSFGRLQGKAAFGVYFHCGFWCSHSGQRWASPSRSQQRCGTCHPCRRGAGRRTFSRGIEDCAEERHLSL